MSKNVSKVEVFKQDSRQLRGNLKKDLTTDETHFDENGKQIIKFHGLYQQDDRDRRKERRRQKKERAYNFMVRSRIPGGKLTAAQYLAHDDLADQYANGTLRITTRQGLQLHGVLKGDLKPTLQAINDTLLTTLGACGDLVRNVMCCPLPDADPIHAAIEKVAQALAAHLSPRTRAYHDLWLDGEKVHNGQAAAQEEEPIYGKTYLPRKFKIGIAAPGDNCIDVYTQDVGLVAVTQAGELAGFNLLVGGGMGMTHNKPETFPRLADELAFVPLDEVVNVVEQIVMIHRDFGDRQNRKHARLKYIVHDWGIAHFKEVLEERLGHALQPPADIPPLELDLHLGWQTQSDGRFRLGISVENGRIQDQGYLRLKSGLRHIVSRFRPGVRLTPNHDVILTDLHPAEIAPINDLLDDYGIPQADKLTAVQRYSMACPALPTCGLALAESERVLPGIIDRLEGEIAALGLQPERFAVRMTGCPNGCARPYVADLAFVGRSPDKYKIFVGGRTDGTRLNQPYADLVPLEELIPTVRPLLVYFKEAGRPEESFGDFCHRLGPEALHAFAEQARETAYA